jgi:hypothetical protein
MYAL